MFHRDGTVRSSYRALHDAIAPTAAADLAVRSEALDRAYVDQGITFSLSGQERPFPLDIVPRVISAGAWDARTGVCQDFAHLALLLVREMGIPARYVSGYLLPRAEVEIRQTVSGESHAWIEAWTGGWWGYDPTNDMEIGHRHVEVAMGRDYSDVAPLKGIYSGGTAAALDVTVDMTRLT